MLSELRTQFPVAERPRRVRIVVRQGVAHEIDDLERV
jgi:hypothetical protein